MMSGSHDDLPEILTTAEVAKLLRISRNSVMKLVEEGKIPQPVFVGARSRRWRKTSVLNAIGAGSGAEVA